MQEDKTNGFKYYRVLYLYTRLIDGEIINKTEEAERFGKDPRSIQRDIDDLRAFFSDMAAAGELNKELVYDTKLNGYYLKNCDERTLTNSEILAVCKILLESRAFCKNDIAPMLEKLILNCVPKGRQHIVKDLISNELYAKDISKKIKSALRTKALKGDCTSGMPPYGYTKDEQDRTRLVHNDKAPYVQMMFQMALEGKSCWEIANILQELKLLIPRAENLVRNGNADSPTFPKYPYSWQKSTIKGILTNPVYTGKTVSHKHEVKSFKDKRIIEHPEEDWIVVENTHEPLVSESDFEMVKARISVKTRDKTTNPDNIFRGIVYCPDCGKRHEFSKRKCDKNSKGAYRCATMVKYGKDYCSNHYITFEQLYEVVLSDVQRHTALAEQDFDKYVAVLSKASDTSKNAEKSSLIREADKAKKRISELDILLQKLYEDKVFGVISEERFLSMSSSMENELSELKARVKQISDYVSENEKNSANASAFAKLFEQYIGISQLDYELVHMLIDKIYIHEREVIDGKSHIKIDICYRFIGNCSEDKPITVIRRKS